MKILYGDFNLDYLLKSFNNQFLTLFEDCNSAVYGFNQFFKSGIARKYK